MYAIFRGALTSIRPWYRRGFRCSRARHILVLARRSRFELSASRSEEISGSSNIPPFFVLCLRRWAVGSPKQRSLVIKCGTRTTFRLNSAVSVNTGKYSRPILFTNYRDSGAHRDSRARILQEVHINRDMQDIKTRRNAIDYKSIKNIHLRNRMIPITNHQKRAQTP